MRIRAIVYTTTDAPNTPRLDQAWDADTAQIADDLGSIRQALADVIAAEGTARAELVDINVPNDLLLMYLQRPRPTVPGTLR